MKKKTIIALRVFLNTPEGQDLRANLREMTPGISPGKSEEIIFSAGVAEGWRRAVNKIDEIVDESNQQEDFDNK